MKKYLRLSVSLLAFLSLSSDVFGTGDTTLHETNIEVKQGYNEIIEKPMITPHGISREVNNPNQEGNETSNATPHNLKGKIINRKNFFIEGKYEIQKGTDSKTTDEDTGAIHNHDQIIILSEGSFTGGGKIVNYESVENDAARTAKRNTYAATESSSLIEDDKLAESAYYDFAHRETDTRGTKIEEFHTADRATIRRSSAASKEAYDASPSGTYVYKKEEVGVMVEPRNGFIQKDTKANKSYYIGILGEKGGLTSIHSSKEKDEISGSIHSLRGYTKLTKEQTIQGLIDSGHQFTHEGNEVNSSNVSGIVSSKPSGDIILEETIDGKTYTTMIATNGVVTTNNPNQIAALPSGNKGTAFSFQRKLSSDTYSYTPIFIPEVDERLVLVKTMPEGSEKTTYESTLRTELEESRRNGSFIFEEWTSDDPVTMYSGANSWYNGVFRLEHGAVVIPQTAELFGGRVEIGAVPTGYQSATEFHKEIGKGNSSAIEAAKTTEPTEFEFEGGPKDEYNRPDIYMNGNATMYFNLAPDSDGNKIFSFYGSLHGTEQDRVIVESGEIRWKGDGSGFRGRLAIAEGAKFEVRSSDAESSSVYEGRFPNANIYQIYGKTEGDHKAGELVTTPTEKTIIDTAGIENIIINNGYMHLTNGKDGEKITFKDSTLEKNSFVEIAGESEVENVTVRGVAVANGKMTTKNLILQGGVLAVQGSIEAENAELGSTIALWGNQNIDSNLTIGTPAKGGNLTIKDGHTLKLFIDANPANGETDGVAVQQNTVIHSQNGVQIGGINFIGDLSSITNSQTFNVITGSTATNIPVKIGALYSGETSATFVAYQNATFNPLPATPVTGGGADTDIRYNYNTTARTVLSTEVLNDGTGGWQITQGDKKYYIYDSAIAGYGKYIIRRSKVRTSVDNFVIRAQAMHLTALDNVSQIFGLVTDDYGYTDKYQTGKFGFWNKTFGGKDKFETNTSNDIKSINYGTVFGFDTKPIIVENSTTEFIGTFLGGTAHKKLKFTYHTQEPYHTQELYHTQEHRANQNSYIAGLKAAFFNRKYSLELIGSYQLVKSDSKKEKYSANIKSHLYSIGTKVAYNFNLTSKISLRPSLLVDYTFAKTPSYSVISTETTNIKNINIVDLVPGISLNGKFGQWRSSIFANYHRRFGSKGSYTFRGTEYHDTTKKNHIEFGLGIDRVALNNRSNIGLKISKKTNGAKGIKASINIGFKF